MTATTTPPYPETLRAMSNHFPFAWAIAHGAKDFEYRTKATKYRGFFLIHASGTTYSDEFIAHCNIPREQVVRKAIIGAANLVACVEDPEDGGYFYELESPIAFAEPIPASGQQSIFWRASTPARDRAFSQAWQLIQEACGPAEPMTLFKIAQEDGLIRISSLEADTTFLIKDEGLWDYLAPYIQDGMVELGESEVANFYEERVQL